MGQCIGCGTIGKNLGKNIGRPSLNIIEQFLTAIKLKDEYWGQVKEYAERDECNADYLNYILKCRILSKWTYDIQLLSADSYDFAHLVMCDTCANLYVDRRTPLLLESLRREFEHVKLLYNQYSPIYRAIEAQKKSQKDAANMLREYAHMQSINAYQSFQRSQMQPHMQMPGQHPPFPQPSMHPHAPQATGHGAGFLQATAHGAQRRSLGARFVSFFRPGQ